MSFDEFSGIIMSGLMFLICLASLVGGLRKKPNPFFWLPDGHKTYYLKKPVHYVIFGIAGILLSVIFVLRFLHILILW